MDSNSFKPSMQQETDFHTDHRKDTKLSHISPILVNELQGITATRLVGVGQDKAPGPAFMLSYCAFLPDQKLEAASSVARACHHSPPLDGHSEQQGIHTCTQ